MTTTLTFGGGNHIGETLFQTTRYLVLYVGAILIIKMSINVWSLFNRVKMVGVFPKSTGKHQSGEPGSFGK